MGNTDWVRRTVQEYLDGWPLALFFDFDGTLTPIVSHPNLTRLADTTRGLLVDLASVDRVSVGILSGRPIEQLKSLVNISGIAYAGSGGMHLDLGESQVIDPALTEFNQNADWIVTAVSRAVRKYRGAWIETKPGCLSIHHRSLTPLMSVCLHADVRELLDSLLEAPAVVRVREVTQSLEITLADAWTKAEAIVRMLASRQPDAFPVFAGDGANDEEAVAHVNALGGVTIGVGPEPPANIHVRVASPEAFAAELSRLRNELSVRRRAATSEGACDRIRGEATPTTRRGALRMESC